MCGKLLFTSIIFADVIANKSFSKGTPNRPMENRKGMTYLILQRLGWVVNEIKAKKKIHRTFETPVLFNQILSYQKSPSRLCVGERKVAAVERKNYRVTKLAMADWLLCLHSLRPANSSLMVQGEPYMLDRNHDKNIFYHRTILIYQVYIQGFLRWTLSQPAPSVGLERRQRIKGLIPGVQMTTGYRKSVS